MSPNLYDLLDVEESASADEVRAAWKAAIADLEPSDRRFRAYNDAAGVLLDPAKRTAYDEELATARASEVADEPEPVAEAEPVAEPDPETETERAAPAVSLAKPEEPDSLPEPEPDTEPADSATDTAVAAEPSTSTAGPALWALAVAGVVALVAVILAVWVLTRPGVADSSQQGSADVTAGHSAIEQFVSDTLVPAMSYDYRTWSSDLGKFEAYMTPTEAAKYKRGWKALGPQVEQQHAIVASHTPSDAPGTGLTRISDDGTRAVVLAFIDQDVRKLATAPFTLKMWATFVLEKDPSTGAWLVDDVCTDTACS